MCFAVVPLWESRRQSEKHTCNHRMRTSAAASIALELTVLTPEDSRASRGVFPVTHAHEPVRRIRPARLAQVPGQRWTAAAALWARRGHSLMRWRDPGETRLGMRTATLECAPSRPTAEPATCSCMQCNLYASCDIQQLAVYNNIGIGVFDVSRNA